MKLLIISDEECPALWDYYTPGKLADYDLIIACGDLKSSYLQFLVTMARCPLLYVHGNHDESYRRNPPEGCDCIDGAVVEYNGLRIAGLGGCRRYHPGAHQYTERQMSARIRSLFFALWRSRGVDILVTHSPAEDLGDAPDPAHHGFACFRNFLDRYKPAYMFHGHVHLRYDSTRQRIIEYNGTTIINASQRYVLEIPDRPVPLEFLNQLRWITRHKEAEDLSYLKIYQK